MRKTIQIFTLMILLIGVVSNVGNETAIIKTNSDLPFEHSIKNNNL